MDIFEGGRGLSTKTAALTVKASFGSPKVSRWGDHAKNCLLDGARSYGRWQHSTSAKGEKFGAELGAVDIDMAGYSRAVDHRRHVT